MTPFARRVYRVIDRRIDDLLKRGSAAIMTEPFGDRKPALDAKAKDQEAVDRIKSQLWAGWRS
jgi:hypothetical protein